MSLTSYRAAPPRAEALRMREWGGLLCWAGLAATDSPVS